MPSFILRPALSAGFVLGLSACYTVDFDELQSGAYYCQTDDDCHETQACEQFRCVDDRGPHLTIIGPEEEPPTVFPLAETAIGVLVTADDIMLTEGNDVTEGFGKLLLAIDPHIANPITVLSTTPSAGLPLGAGLSEGPHRIVATAVFGDGTPYTNPGATDHTVFFSANQGAPPQIAILEPGPGYVHVVGEPLAIQIINRGFDFLAAGDDCHVGDDCLDPFAVDSTCAFSDDNCTKINKSGHTHIYIRPDYPDCLVTTPLNPLSCNDDYVAAVLPADTDSAHKITYVVPGEKFKVPGEVMLRASLQYNNHKPYPNVGLVIYDELPITIVER